MNPRPLYTEREAVRNARSQVGRGVYRLGTGNAGSSDFDERDCFGFAVCECFGIVRHRPGFNRGWTDPAGRTPDVVDDLNCNSAIEDAEHAKDLFRLADYPRLGVLIMYPTIRLPGHAQPWIGHVQIVVGLQRCHLWAPDKPDWAALDTVECRGPDGRKPGILATNGFTMVAHDRTWPRPEHRTRMIEVIP